MPTSRESHNIERALRAFELLFNERDLVAAAAYWSPEYVQHSALVPPGRDGLFRLAEGFPPGARYENQLAAAADDFVMLHGRFSGVGERALIAADILRFGADGLFVEHWDVLQDEATEAESASGRPMFGVTFPEPVDS